MGKARLCDTERLLRWAANRQMRQEGGFQGWSNKLLTTSTPSALSSDVYRRELLSCEECDFSA